MKFKVICALVVVGLVSQLSSAAFAQNQCSASQDMGISALEQGVFIAKTMHSGCMAREQYAFDKDPNAYIEAYGTNFFACNQTILSRINCNDSAERLCGAKRNMDAAVQRCRQSLNNENDLAEDAASELNDQRREDGGANSLSKDLTEDALQRLDSETGVALNSLQGASDQLAEDSLVSGDIGNSSVAIGTAGASTSQSQIGAEISPEFQAILDLSVEDLRRATQDGELSVDAAQRILDQGLQEIVSDARRRESQLGDEAFGNQGQGASDSELEARMRRQLESFRPRQQSDTQEQSSATRRSMSCSEADLLQRQIGAAAFRARFYRNVSESVWRSCGAHGLQPWEILCNAYNSGVKYCLSR